MPCDTITTQSIKLAKAMPELVKQALEETGWRITSNITTHIVAEKSYFSIVWETGKGLTIDSNNNEKHLNEITQTYSKKAITWAAQRAGWQVTNQTKNTLQVTRR